MKANTSEYKEYLASREWAVLREKVRERSNNKCERCRTNAQEAVHHLTYERIGHELLEDLQAICTPCHEFLSGKRDIDPVLRRYGFTYRRMLADFESILLCPSCDHFYTHIEKTYKEDDPEWRQSAHVIRCWCENCDRRFEIIFQEHKGNIYLQWRICI